VSKVFLNCLASAFTSVFRPLISLSRLCTALMIVKAADKLGINIDVSMEDVLAYYGIGKRTSSSSFPFPF
jgi:hypothetical protein